MMYVIKIGEYYVKSVELTRYEDTRRLKLNDILLSKEIMRNFDKQIAELIAKKINGEIIIITEEVTINE